MRTRLFLALPVAGLLALPLGCDRTSTCPECTAAPASTTGTTDASTDADEEPMCAPPESTTCEGSPEPPPEFAAKLEPTDNPTLLADALGQPNAGKLCQGQVFRVTEGFTLYRAWNSTNPGSELGNWWAFSQPDGSVAQYREDYEICYQWSPLDKLTSCTIKAGTEVVIGNGQSACCSEYLSYPASAALQIYIEDASTATEGCAASTAAFEWRE